MVSVARSYVRLPIVRFATLNSSIDMSLLYCIVLYLLILYILVVEVSSSSNVSKCKENTDAEATQKKPASSTSSSALSSFLSSLNTSKASSSPVTKKPKESKPSVSRTLQQTRASPAANRTTSCSQPSSSPAAVSSQKQDDGAHGTSAQPADEDASTATSGTLTSGTLQLLVELLRAFTNADRDGRFVCTWAPAVPPGPGPASSSPSPSSQSRCPPPAAAATSGQQTRRDREVSTATLKYILLNPLEHVADVVRQARSFILAGGTMQPVLHKLNPFLFCPELLDY